MKAFVKTIGAAFLILLTLPALFIGGLCLVAGVKTPKLDQFINDVFFAYENL